MMKTYSALEIARYFLAQAAVTEDLISNLKLQKLCYYAQGLAVAVRGEPLFDEPVEAWLHGPVVPDLYREFRDHKASAIPPVTDLVVEDYAPEDRLLLDDVVSYYGQYSAWRLREMTHEEAPWVKNFGDDGRKVIPLEDLREHFSGEVSVEYRNKYEQVSEKSVDVSV